MGFTCPTYQIAFGVACTTKRTTGRTSRPGPNLALRQANAIVGVYYDYVVHLVGTSAGQPSEVDLAG